MKHLFSVFMVAATAFVSAAPSHAADGLVCTSVVRSDLSSGVPLPLHNGSKFNCGPEIQGKTIRELSAAGWIIITVQFVHIAPYQGAWQLVVQK
jgi:hypothetical protein